VKTAPHDAIDGLPALRVRAMIADDVALPRASRSPCGFGPWADIALSSRDDAKQSALVWVRFRPCGPRPGLVRTCRDIIGFSGNVFEAAASTYLHRNTNKPASSAVLGRPH